MKVNLNFIMPLQYLNNCLIYLPHYEFLCIRLGQSMSLPPQTQWTSFLMWKQLQREVLMHFVCSINPPTAHTNLISKTTLIFPFSESLLCSKKNTHKIENSWLKTDSVLRSFQIHHFRWHISMKFFNIVCDVNWTELSLHALPCGISLRVLII